MKRDFFDKENLKVQLITFRGTHLMLTALLTGELDYAICVLVTRLRIAESNTNGWVLLLH